MEILIFCGIYLVELACYLIVMRMLFDVRVNKKVWVVACFMMPTTIGILMPIMMKIIPVNASGKNVLITIGIILVMFLSIDNGIMEKVIKIGLVFIVLECVEGFYLHIFESFITYIGDNYLNNLKYLILKSITVVSILLFRKIKGNFINKINIQINSSIYFVISAIMFSMIFCLEVLNKVKMYLPNNYFIRLCDILDVVILLNIFLLVIFVIYIKNTHEQMKKLLKTERFLKDSQMNYYKQVLKKERDTRKYRHDMMNHLVYIQELLSRGRFENAQKYLSDILGGFMKIQKSYYIVGNEMVDTIMNYFFGMLPKDVKINIMGKCPVEIDIEETDVCTIFSNLFQNAVEEILENNIKNAYIMVYVQKGKSYVEYDIKNSLLNKINEKSIDKSGLPKSCKLDKRNHGIGMVNVKSTVERNNGRFKWCQDDNCFSVNVILPIK